MTKTSRFGWDLGFCDRQEKFDLVVKIEIDPAALKLSERSVKRLSLV
jgi:hypothetical protein